VGLTTDDHNFNGEEKQKVGGGKRQNTETARPFPAREGPAKKKLTGGCFGLKADYKLGKTETNLGGGRKQKKR